jgi:hypothetical protein
MTILFLYRVHSVHSPSTLRPSIFLVSSTLSFAFSHPPTASDLIDRVGPLGFGPSPWSLSTSTHPNPLLHQSFAYIVYTSYSPVCYAAPSFPQVDWSQHRTWKRVFQSNISLSYYLFIRAGQIPGSWFPRGSILRALTSQLEMLPQKRSYSSTSRDQREENGKPSSQTQFSHPPGQGLCKTSTLSEPFRLNLYLSIFRHKLASSNHFTFQQSSDLVTEWHSTRMNMRKKTAIRNSVDPLVHQKQRNINEK